MPTMCVSLFSYVGLIYQGLSPTLTHPHHTGPKEEHVGEYLHESTAECAPIHFFFKDFDRMLPLDVNICFKMVGVLIFSVELFVRQMYNIILPASLGPSFYS